MENDWSKPFIAAMHNGAMKEAHALIRRIILTGVKKALDVGGGSGVFSIAITNARPEPFSTVSICRM